MSILKKNKNVKNIINFSNIYFSKLSKIFSKIDFENQILIFNKDKSIKLFKDTNQLYIDNPDTSILDFVLPIINLEKKISILNKIDETNYLIDMKYNSNQYFITLNEMCDKIESIKIINENIVMDIQDIIIQKKNINDYDEIFFLNGEYFEYDLRN